MKTYNRALDYTLLALNELTKGNAPLAAKLMATAVKQKDIRAAIATLETSNAYAAKVQANRLRASDFGDEGMDFGDDGEDMGEIESDFDEGDMDPLDEVDMDDDMGEEEPAEQMARVLSKMVRKSRR